MDLTIPQGWPEAARPALENLLAGARAAHTDQLAIHWNGTVHDWHSEYGSGPIQTMSVTKSIVGLVMGRLRTLGTLESLDLPVHELYPEWRQGRKTGITVRMLMEHTSGLQNVPMTTEEIYPSPDFIQLALSAELSSDPGAEYSYNNKAVNLLAGLVERLDGRKLDRFAQEELFEPLGIDDFGWMSDSAGNPHAMSGLALRAADLVLLGKLLLRRGQWNGERLISDDWFEEMDGRGGQVRESALMWWNVHEAKVVVTEAHLQLLKDAAAPADFIPAFARQKENPTGFMRFFVSLRKELGFWQERLPEGIQPFEIEYGRKLAYRAEGDLGQYVYAFPESGLVVARLISETTIAALVPDFGRPESVEEHMRLLEPYFFTDFDGLATELSTALAASRV